MKPLYLIAIAALGMELMATAQVPSDTIVGRCDRYHYTHWYDECPAYLIDTENDPYSEFFGEDFLGMSRILLGEHQLLAKQEYCEGTMRIKGLVALVISGPNDFGIETQLLGSIYFGDFGHEEEFMSLYSGEVADPRKPRLLEQVRWDTAQPILMKLPKSAYVEGSNDDTKYRYCYAYEAYFKEPVTVNSSFFITGTSNTNIIADSSTYTYLHKPISYADPMIIDRMCTDCPTHYPVLYTKSHVDSTVWHLRNWGQNLGFFLAIKADDTVRIAEVETHSLDFDLAPNPARDELTVSLGADDHYQLDIFDMAGRCLLQQSFHGSSVTLKLDSLPAGMYQLRVRSTAGQSTQSFIKQ